MTDATSAQRLDDLHATLAMFDEPSARAELLISLSDQFEEVPPDVAVRPFSQSHRVPQCESEVYVWVRLTPERRLALHFAVENPSGISGRALSVVLKQVYDGQPPEDLLALDPGIVEAVFRQNISMGKGLGLQSIVLAAQALTRDAVRRSQQ